MYIQIDTKTRLPKGVVLSELPAVYWLSPIDSIPVTAENAESLGYVDLEKFFKATVQDWLDGAAVARGYDDIVSACSYAAAPNPFQAESLAFITLRGNVWAYCFTEFGKILSGERSLPDDIGTELSQFLSVLP